MIVLVEQEGTALRLRMAPAAERQLNLMGIKTGIEWCDSTLNLEIGCDGCELWNPKAGEKTCYAGQLVERYGGHSTGYPESFDKPMLFPRRLLDAERWKDLTGTDRPDKPWLNGMPRLIFLDDMGDTFTESLPLDWLSEHMPRLGALPHIIILLTKRASRMLEFSKEYPFPKNFWLMVSVTSAANYNRVEQLMQVRGGSIKGISYEPAWGPVNFVPWMPRLMALDEIPGSALNDGCAEMFTAGLGWVISGGSSGATAKPSHTDWFRNVRNQCMVANVPFFHKQNGEWLEYYDRDINDPDWRNVPKVVDPKERFVNIDGGHGFHGDRVLAMRMVGKKKAGAMLDGRHWRQLPTV